MIDKDEIRVHLAVIHSILGYLLARDAKTHGLQLSELHNAMTTTLSDAALSLTGRLDLSVVAEQQTDAIYKIASACLAGMNRDDQPD